MGGGLRMFDAKLPWCLVQGCEEKSVMFLEGVWLCGFCYKKVLEGEVLKLK